MVTSTDQGGGRPRLVFSMGGSAPQGAMPREFVLRELGTTRIGSAADADLQLDGLAERHAEIRCHDDEYVLLDLGAPGGSRVDGQPVEHAALHTGDRIELGDWTMSYLRDEYADHGRPDGGRSGGESLHEHPRDDMPESG
jgi:Inner membrane component of T3SS, cytoplasmic domain